MMQFLNSTFFQTCVMFAVGLFTYLVYNKQKKDCIKNAAAIVKLEIDNIEKSLDRLKLINLTEEIYKTAPLYQTLEWFKIRNLFINKLDVEIFDVINRFYEVVIRCEDARNRIKEAVHLNRIDKINAVQSKTQDILANLLFENENSKDKQDLSKYIEVIKKYEFLYNNIANDFMMNSVVQHYESSLSLIFNISNTPAYEKLKEIIKRG